MSKGSIFFFSTITILLLIVIIYRFEQYQVEKNFYIYGTVACDTEFESCFGYECAAEDAECEISAYKKVELHASNAPKCLFENDCSSFSCTNLENCSETYCSEETLEDGEVCLTRS